MKNHGSLAFKFAVYHVPLYPSVRFSKVNLPFILFSLILLILFRPLDIKNLLSSRSLKGQKLWEPLFSKYKLKVAFEHHEHALKRTKSLKSGKVDDNGCVYLGDGGFGPKKLFPPIQKFFNSYFAKVEKKNHFFWKMKIGKKETTYQAISLDNKVIDQFSQKI